MENESEPDIDILTTKERLENELLLSKVPIRKRLKPEKPNLKIRKDIFSKAEISFADNLTSSEVEPAELFKEPTEKVTLIERAIGYFNAEKDEQASNTDLNLSLTKGPPYTCVICQSWFYVGAKLKVHYLLNHGRFHCTVCGCLFDKEEEKETHLQTVHSPIFCEVCKIQLNNHSELIEHYDEKHNAECCKFCGILLQPKCSFEAHVVKKHQITDNFLTNPREKFAEKCQTSTEFFCDLCDKNRDYEIFYGHMTAYHKINVNCLMNILIKVETGIKVDGTSLAERQNGEKEEIIPFKGIKPTHYGCNVCFTRYSRKIPMGFHYVYCQNKIQCRHCRKFFDSVKLRDKHVDKTHFKFPCTLGCEKLAYNNEENLNNHFVSFHEITTCRYCDVFISSNNEKFQTHLEETHKYKAVIMKNITDSLFEVTESEGKNFVVCCLCDENITLLTESTRDIFSHFSVIHGVSTRRILQLVTPKPSLSEYEDFYREINEQIKLENIENCTSPENLIGHQEESNKENEEDEEESVTNLKEKIPKKTPKIKIKSEPDDFQSDSENENENPDYSELYPESSFESDFDITEVEALVDSDSDLEVETNLKNCDLCGLENISTHALIMHIRDNHKIKMKSKEIECEHCPEVLFSDLAFENHLFLKHKDISFHDATKKFFKCGCERNCVVNFARRHILEEHSDKLQRYDVQELGLKCRFCEVRYWERTELNEHEVFVHFKEHPTEFLKCYKCLTVFSSQKCLKNHTKLCHEESDQYTKLTYKCQQCFITYPNAEILRDHFKSSHPEMRLYWCPIPKCYKACKQKKYLKAHLKMPHKNKKVAKPEPCDVCGKMMKSARAHAIHKMMKHKRERAGFQCRICHSRFQTSEQRKLHYSTSHSGELAYTCLECGKGFVSKSGLYGHKRIHQTQITLTCPYCSKEFSRRDSYNEHLLIHVGPKHQCPHCPKSFTQRSNLTRHVRIHTGAKPYQCIYCEKRFSDRGACRSHEKVHTKEEHCECEVCGKTFTKRQKLKYHMKFHTGEGLLTCEVCGKQFSNGYSLTEHRKIHDQQTMVMCECGRGFTSEKYLQRHMVNVHKTTAPKYSCPLCFKPLYHRSAYNNHIMTHTPVKHIKCMLCDAEYYTRKTVRRHLQEKHNLKSDEDLGAFIQTLTPEEAGLNLPPPTELQTMGIELDNSQIKNISELLDDKNMIRVDISQLETLNHTETQFPMNHKKKRKVPKAPKKGGKFKVKEEPMSDNEDNFERNDFQDNHLEENENNILDVVLNEPRTRAKRKIKKPRRYSPKEFREKKRKESVGEENEDEEGENSREKYVSENV